LKRRIYTAGTGTREIEEFIALLEGEGIEVAVDVRAFPTSRFPHFKREELSRHLEGRGIEYLYLGKELGGYRKGGYQAHMETEEFQRGIEELQKVAKERRTVFFCAETLPWRCHRRFIAQRLKEEGWEVIHLI